ncbi:hypothetical protein AG1IA_10247 [Rhizoctonia solani AG-1 IA]|uniref:Uncharacterized protein n=1 Tax=Thanatephorus cucumeris (strain AG1-IA) TaxID=983506 RepID=L8WG17_THACA|nr:hypothetical protein AG1IA_10247 [Rhizoctonia solani AG-1 IA]
MVSGLGAFCGWVNGLDDASCLDGCKVIREMERADGIDFVDQEEKKWWPQQARPWPHQLCPLLQLLAMVRWIQSRREHGRVCRSA